MSGGTNHSSVLRRVISRTNLLLFFLLYLTVLFLSLVGFCRGREAPTAEGEGDTEVESEVEMHDTELAKLSVAELKKQLHDRGVSTEDCLEKSDLVTKLSASLESSPTAKASSGSSTSDVTVPQKNVDGSPFGRVCYTGNTKSPKGMVVVMHGLGDTCDGWTDVAEFWSQRHKDLLFVLPTAPQIPVTLNMGARMPAWFDITSLAPNAPDDDKRIMDSANYVQALAHHNCIKYNIPRESVVFGGFSQGGVVALHSSLWASAVRPKGVFMMSGFLSGRATLLSKAIHKTIPLLMCHGTSDPMVPMPVAQMSYKALQQAVGMSNTEWKEYPGMQHSACPQEMSDVSAWFNKIGFGESRL